MEWEQRVAVIGHGKSAELLAHDASDIAKTSKTQTRENIDQNDPQELETGTQVSIKPAVDGGEVETIGLVQAADSQSISILRSNDRVGEVCVHFPRVGYEVKIL